MPGPNANVQIAVRSDTSKLIKSAITHLIKYTISHSYPYTLVSVFILNRSAVANHRSHALRLCPLLNGTMKQEDGFGDSAFTLSAPAL